MGLYGQVVLKTVSWPLSLKNKKKITSTTVTKGRRSTPKCEEKSYQDVDTAKGLKKAQYSLIGSTFVYE